MASQKSWSKRKNERQLSDAYIVIINNQKSFKIMNMRKTLVIFILLASIFSCEAQPGISVEVARPLNNAPTPSTGYGKDLGDFKSGIYTITSAGLERQYTIDIPKNYDKNKQSA